MKKYLILSFVVVELCFACNNNGSSAKTATAAGEQLFKINCSQCHRPNEDFVGPALKNVVTRWTNKDLLYEFIKQSQDVIDKNPYAKKLYIKWKMMYMQPFPNLSNEDIDRILEYCDNAQQ